MNATSPYRYAMSLTDRSLWCNDGFATACVHSLLLLGVFSEIIPLWEHWVCCFVAVCASNGFGSLFMVAVGVVTWVGCAPLSRMNVPLLMGSASCLSS